MEDKICVPSVDRRAVANDFDKSNLWSLQFERWWGWNWLRKREETVKKKLFSEDFYSSSPIKQDVYYYRGERPNFRKKPHLDVTQPRSKFNFEPRRPKMHGAYKERPRHVRLDQEARRKIQDRYATPCVSHEFIVTSGVLESRHKKYRRSHKMKTRCRHCCGESSESSNSTLSTDGECCCCCRCRCCCRSYAVSSCNVSEASESRCGPGNDCAPCDNACNDATVQTCKNCEDRCTQTYVPELVHQATHMEPPPPPPPQPPPKKQHKKRKPSKKVCCCRCRCEDKHAAPSTKCSSKPTSKLGTRPKKMVDKGQQAENKAAYHHDFSCHLCSNYSIDNGDKHANSVSKRLFGGLESVSADRRAQTPRIQPVSVPVLTERLRESYENTRKMLQQYDDDDSEHRNLMDSIMSTLWHHRNGNDGGKTAGLRKFLPDFKNFYVDKASDEQSIADFPGVRGEKLRATEAQLSSESEKETAIFTVNGNGGGGPKLKDLAQNRRIRRDFEDDLATCSTSGNKVLTKERTNYCFEECSKQDSLSSDNDNND